MRYQETSKELLGSWLFTADEPFMDMMESSGFYGNATRVSTREGYISQGGYRFSMSVYRPEEMRAGVIVGVRLLQKARQGVWLYKLVFVPAPDDMSRWQEAMTLPFFDWYTCFYDIINQSALAEEQLA